MNYLAIHKLSDLNTVFEDQILLNRNQKDEIEHNMWALSFEKDAFYVINLDNLSHFIEKLLKHYSEIVIKKYPLTPALFYLWLDPQVLQLRFNVLSQTPATALPFACKVNIVKNYSGILQAFLDMNNQFILEGDVIEEVDEFDEDDENDSFVLDVYVKRLNK